jgi:short-subunit dehydrogenase
MGGTVPRPINEQVVVITGASSGVGRETALSLAEQGATVVLAARNEEALSTLAAEVARLGGTTQGTATDVAEWQQVQQLAAGTVERFGRIDTWVNCAATSIYGPVHTLTAQEITRTITVILLGQVYGMKAALDTMRPQGYGGIINVASALAVRAVPLQAPYCAAKHGVRGFAEALRMELAHENRDVTVTTLLPSSINTPLFDHARSKLGVLPAPLPPVYEPNVVAAAILHAIEHPQPEVFVGGAGKIMDVLQRLAPRSAGRILLRVGKAVQKQHSTRGDDGVDNLDWPSQGPGTSDGNFGAHSKSSSLYTTYLEQHPTRIRLALGAAALTALALARRK